MRLGILTDVHANIDALDVALRDGQQLVERWWFLGDAVGRGPFAVETVQRLREVIRPAHWLVGNHDLYVTGALATNGLNPADQFTWRDHVRQLRTNRSGARVTLWSWCRRAWRLARAAPRRIQATLADFWLVHAALGNEWYNVGDVAASYLMPWRHAEPRQILDGQFEQLNAQRAPGRTAVLIHGHTHIPYLAVQRSGDDHHELAPIRYGEWQPLTDFQAVFINPGSVGQPRNSDPRVHAAYGILDTSACAFMFRHVPYDAERTRLKMAELDYDLNLIRQLEGNHAASALRDTHALWLEWDRTYRSQSWGWEPVTSNEQDGDS